MLNAHLQVLQVRLNLHGRQPWLLSIMGLQGGLYRICNLTDKGNGDVPCYVRTKAGGLHQVLAIRVKKQG